jgi:hypothetical protein
LHNREESSETRRIHVDVIAERDGQKLRGFILNTLRDLRFAKKKYRLKITLLYTEKPFAYSTDGNAKRLRLSYTANVILKNENGDEIFSRPISVHTSSNIASAHGEVVLVLYGRNNNALLRELSGRIVENIKVFLESES